MSYNDHAAKVDAELNRQWERELDRRSGCDQVGDHAGDVDAEPIYTDEQLMAMNDALARFMTAASPS